MHLGRTALRRCTISANMDFYPKPHSAEWFKALQTFNPVQAVHTRSVLEAAGREDVCSVCGDFPAEDLKIIGRAAPPLASIRLCRDCRKMRSSFQGESYEPLL
jgi:hypothetical protein